MCGRINGGEAFTDEDLQDFVDLHAKEFVSDTGEKAEIIDYKLTKVSGASAMMLRYRSPGSGFYNDMYKIITDNYLICTYAFNSRVEAFESQKYNEIISSIKVKDTIALQNDGVPFNDVSNKQWYHAPIKYVYEKGYISGLNAYTYGPNVNLSRCMLVTILWRISGNPAAKGNVSFPDIKESDWYYTPVIWAAENGIVNGYGNGKFGPNDNISREQLATMLRNYAIFRGKDKSYSEDSISTFQDSKKVADWAMPGVAWAIKNQIIGGKNNGTIIDPQGNATRAEVATMIMKLDTNVLK